MLRTIENHGAIEILSINEPVAPGDVVKLLLRHDEVIDPPLRLRIDAPSGEHILDRELHEVPTGHSNAPSPVTFTPATPGAYRIRVEQLEGPLRGEAVLHVQETA